MHTGLLVRVRPEIVNKPLTLLGPVPVLKVILPSVNVSRNPDVVAGVVHPVPAPVVQAKTGAVTDPLKKFEPPMVPALNEELTRVGPAIENKPLAVTVVVVATVEGAVMLEMLIGK